MIGIAFGMDDLGLVAEAGNDQAAGHGRVGAGIARIVGAGQLESADIRHRRLGPEPQRG
jgi:hypothetical protein